MSGRLPSDYVNEMLVEAHDKVAQTRERLVQSFEEVEAAVARNDELVEALSIAEDSRFARARALFNSLVQVTQSPKQIVVASEGDKPSVKVDAFSLATARKRLIDRYKHVRASQIKAHISCSIIVPVYNHAEMTLLCLESIADTWTTDFIAEVIVVDDCSTDASQRLFSKIPGITYVRSKENSGFVTSCNLGAKTARGKYLCFLNNDTLVKPGWLTYLVDTLASDGKIGAVGAKLVYPDGRLQEAGGIIFRDGSGWNYGRYDDPRDPMYNYRREVDYCSGAALMVRTALFNKLGGFNNDLKPAYYEDVDLCFAVRNAGYKVVYDPRAEIVHFEGISSGTDLASGMKRFQEINRPKFEKRWKDALLQHPPNDPARVYKAARRYSGSSGTVVIVDSYVPMHDREAGSLRLLQIIKILLANNYRVVFAPDNQAAIQPYTAELEALGVEVIYYVEGLRSCAERLNEAIANADVFWVCRPDLYPTYVGRLASRANLKVVYDTIDLHFLRLRRQAEIEHNESASTWEAVKEIELRCAADADITITVSEYERKILSEHQIRNVHIVPTIHNMSQQRVAAYRDTSGILFIGGYNHTPNVDAANWLIKDIMPKVWAKIPSMHVTLLGSGPPDTVKALSSERVSVPGFVEDVTPYFLSNRIFVAPIRYGAGLKGKIGQALSFGIPIITTTTGAEGFSLRDRVDYMNANSSEEFADAIVALYKHRKFWDRLANTGDHALKPFSMEAVAKPILNILQAPTSRLL